MKGDDFDDILQAVHVHPPLTTVRQPLEKIGCTATRMLLEYIKDPQRPIERVELATELMIRQLCHPQKRLNKEVRYRTVQVTSFGQPMKIRSALA
ncbi:MAG: substrate-binding domain-containing protein [Anaerolineae bacterium]|nr:substrate-binding domain-containing protein [Anaerolineae bacterium]